MVMLAGTDDHRTRLRPVILNLESTGLTHLESEIRVISKISINTVNQLLQYKSTVIIVTVCKKEGTLRYTELCFSGT